MLPIVHKGYIAFGLAADLDNYVTVLCVIVNLQLTREWYREDFRCVCATRRGQARHDGHYMGYPAQRLPYKA